MLISQTKVSAYLDFRKMPNINQQQLLPIKKFETSRCRNRKKYNQYFTPEFAVEKALSFIPITKVKNIIDPAAGNGTFLKVASKKWDDAKLFGVDIDTSAIQNFKRTKLPHSVYFAGDSLLKETWEEIKIKKIISDGGFDIVVGNPPFSSWFHRIESSKILTDYKLAHKDGKLMKSQAIEVLFIEIFIRLTKAGGYVAIVLPDGILSNPQYRYVRKFILVETQVKHIINLPRNIFEDTSAKTSILILKRQMVKNSNYKTRINDLDKNGTNNHTIKIPVNNLINRMDYRYYYQSRKSSINKLINRNVPFRTLKDFVVYCKKGKTLYGKERKFSEEGLRFIHTTNLTDIGINYKKDEKFISPCSKMYSKDAYTKVGDILIARVGDGCVGRTAIVASKKDIGCISDCIFMIKVKNISPYFVALFLKTKSAKEWFKMIKHGSGTTSINKDEILSIPIPSLHGNSQKALKKKYKKIIIKFHRNGTDKISKIYQPFEKLIKNVEAKIINGKKI